MGTSQDMSMKGMLDNPTVSNISSYDSDIEDDEYYDNEFQNKRRKLNNDERLQRCRERNRVHARNTRERKRAQMDFLQKRIQELFDEKYRLETTLPETSVASILVSLSTSQHFEAKCNTDISRMEAKERENFAANTIERLKNEISATLSDDDELEMNQDLLGKDKSSCNSQELELIRRERNRMHAKKTRLRKKRMLMEMETIIYQLEEDIRRLRQKNNLSVDGYQLYSHRISNGMNSKFTGFRQTKRTDISSTGSTSSSVNSSSMLMLADESMEYEKNLLLDMQAGFVHHFSNVNGSDCSN